MKIVVYDSNPGPGWKNFFLKLSWIVGCFIQKSLGKIDKFYGASSWQNAVYWLYEQKGADQIQFWGHGSPGKVYISGQAISTDILILILKDVVNEKSLVWFRCCSVFRGVLGHQFSEQLANSCGCTIAGHTRIIGIVQGGLHTRKPFEDPRWSVDEGEFPRTLLSSIGLKWGNNSILFFQSEFPKDW